MGLEKIDAFLRGRGVVGNKSQNENTSRTSKNASKSSTSAKSDANSPRGNGFSRSTGTDSSARRRSFGASSGKRSQDARRTGNASNSSRGGSSRAGSGRFRQVSAGSVRPGNNDPFFNRPTVEKREKFHPTKFFNAKNAGEIRVVPLGGMEQVGSNLMFIESRDDIVLIDMGFNFPSPEHLGIDILIPDVSYLVKNRSKIRGVIITHGHLDHIGGIPHIAPSLGFPQMYATRLTKALILANSEESGVARKLKIAEINPKSKIKLGKFEFEFFHINHSIPDGVGIVCHTPFGSIVHTSDFKFDYNPSDDQPIDLARIGKIGKEGVILALSDSTSVQKSGHTISESVIENTLERIVRDTSGRLVIATFASNIGRASKIIEMAEKCGRTVFLSGRSMERNMAIARKLNYLKCRDNTLQPMSSKADKLPPSKVLILSTGSQGEELAALTRMAAGTHRDIKLRSDDTVVFSSSPIPGNETAIVAVQNNLADIGCVALDSRELDIHVSGHAHAEECKLMLSLLNPRFFAPIHGEVFMREAHRRLAIRDLQMRETNTFCMKNGRGVVISASGARLMTEKESLASPEILIELGERVGERILADRTQIAASGILLVHIRREKGVLRDIEIRARGFLYAGQEHEIFKQLKKEVRDSWDRNFDPARGEKSIEKAIASSIARFCHQKFKKEPAVEVIFG